jgi:flagellar hook-associated protein 2
MSSSSSSTLFNGTSRYSADFQSVISRSVSIASLQLNLMESQATTLTNQKTEASLLDSKLTALQSAVTGLSTALGSSSYSAATSDSTIATVSTGTNVTAGTYTIEVTDLGSYNNTMSADGLTKVTDPSSGNLSPRTNFTLTAGGETYSFTAANLNAMVSAINGSGLSVQASLVNVGSSSAPDYRLSVQGTKLGALAISLTDDDATPSPTEMLSTQADGGLASYKVNGYSTAATSDSRTVEIAPGVTVNLLAASGAGKATTITVSRTTASVKNALASFVTAYNAATTEVANNRGDGGGALTGDSLIQTISNALSQIQGYSPGTGSFSSLEDLGVQVDQTGQLSFDTSVFDTATAGKLTDLTNFLGGTTTSGFLKVATDALSGLENTDSGAVTTTINLLSTEITSQNDSISAEQDRITLMQTNLQSQMAAADAAIAALEQQASYITSLFGAMKTASDSANK